MCSVIAQFPQFRDTKDNGWFLRKLSNCGALGVVCLVNYHMHLVWLIVFCCDYLFERVEEFC